MARHRIRVTGTGARGTRISAPLLRELLAALVDSAEQALRLRVEGRSRVQGKPPSWLEKAAAFDLVAIEEGSSVLVLEAQAVASSAPERFAQLQLFAPFDVGRSPLGLLEESLGDALAEREDSDLYDDGLIATFRDFDRALRLGAERIDLVGSEVGDGSGLTIDGTSLRTLERLRSRIPGDQRVIVAGKLDELRHADRFFTLILDGGERVRGVLSEGEIDLESLGRLWGKPVRVHGVAKFRPSGAVLRVDADRIEPAQGDVSLWSKVPGPVLDGGDLRLTARPQGPRSGLAAIFGKWPGDETDEEILAALAELS